MGFKKKKRAAPVETFTDPQGQVFFGSLASQRKEQIRAAEAERARQEQERIAAENRRRETVAQGRGYIDSAFGAFDDNYFNNLKSSYANYFDSGVQNEYAQKRNDIAGALQNTQGSAAFDFVGKLDALDREYQNRRSSAQSMADNYVGGIRNEVNRQKNALLSQNEATADLGGVQQNTNNFTNSIRSRQFSPLGSFFANIQAQPGMSTAPNQPGGNVNYGSFTSATGSFNPAAFNIAPSSTSRVVS